MIRVTAVRLLIIATLGFMLAACKGKDGGASADDCAAAVNHLLDLQMAVISKDLEAESKAQVSTAMATARSNLAASCKEMKWSKDAIGCLKALKDAAGAAACDAMLTKEQRDAADKATDIDPPAAGSAGSGGAM